MSLINFFKREKFECPRCLGKGHVDLSDIKRLNKELEWVPGKCAYCAGAGKVDNQTIENVDVDEIYLTTDIPSWERDLLIKGDERAHQRAYHFGIQVEDFIKQVEYLNTVGKLEANKIADFYLVAKAEGDKTPDEHKELLETIQKILNRTNNSEGQ